MNQRKSLLLLTPPEIFRYLNITHHEDDKSGSCLLDRITDFGAAATE